MNEPTIIHGPIIPFQARMVYSITLLSGHIVTSPDGFGAEEEYTPPKNESKSEYPCHPRDYSPQCTNQDKAKSCSVEGLVRC